jgi:hypothetical protein
MPVTSIEEAQTLSSCPHRCRIWRSDVTLALAKLRHHLLQPLAAVGGNGKLTTARQLKIDQLLRDPGSIRAGEEAGAGRGGLGGDSPVTAGGEVADLGDRTVMGIARNTVKAALAAEGPPQYRRAPGEVQWWLARSIHSGKLAPLAFHLASALRPPLMVEHARCQGQCRVKQLVRQRPQQAFLDRPVVPQQCGCDARCGVHRRRHRPRRQQRVELLDRIHHQHRDAVGAAKPAALSLHTALFVAAPHVPAGNETRRIHTPTETPPSAGSPSGYGQTTPGSPRTSDCNNESCPSAPHPTGQTHKHAPPNTPPGPEWQTPDAPAAPKTTTAS